MFDILILSNGPGEITTWVRPVVKALRNKLGHDRNNIRISVVLSPCSNASGKEADIALSYPEVDRVQSALGFFPSNRGISEVIRSGNRASGCWLVGVVIEYWLFFCEGRADILRKRS